MSWHWQCYDLDTSSRLYDIGTLKTLRLHHYSLLHFKFAVAANARGPESRPLLWHWNHDDSELDSDVQWLPKLIKNVNLSEK